MSNRYLPQAAQARRPMIADSDSDDDVYEEMGDNDLASTPGASKNKSSPKSTDEYEEYMEYFDGADASLSVLNGVPSSGSDLGALETAPLEQWTTRQVTQFLDRLGIGEYKNKFAQEGLDGSLISWLDHNDLRDLGMGPLGHRVTFLAAVESLARRKDTDASDTDDNDSTEDTPTPTQSSIMQGSQQTLSGSLDDKRRGNDLQQRLRLTEKRLATTEEQLQKLSESYNRLRSLVMPLVRKIKEGEPLPTPISSKLNPQHLPLSYSTSSIHRATARGPVTSPVTSGGQQTSATASSTLLGSESSAAPINLVGQSSASLAVIPPAAFSPRSATGAGLNNADSFGDPIAHSASSPPPEHPYHQKLSQNASSEAKKFKVTIDQPCVNVLPMVLKKYKIEGNPEHYRLLVSYGDQERELSKDEKPFVVYRELQVAGLKPVFVVRQIHDANVVTPTVRTPGGII